MNIARSIVCAAALLGASSMVSAAPIGFSISDANRTLYSIDLANGAATAQGVINYAVDDDLEGLASINGVLFAVSEANNGTGTLWNVSTPPGTQLGTNTRFGTEAGAAYSSSNGILYNIQGDDLAAGVKSALYSINPVNGAATLLGTSQTYADGLAINAAGEAFASDFQLTDSLYRVNLADGGLTLVGSLGIGNVAFDSGLAFDSDGTLYALREDGVIYTINTGTGAATFRAFVTAGGVRVPGDLEGLDIPGQSFSVPEPASMSILGLGLASLLAMRRRGVG